MRAINDVYRNRKGHTDDKLILLSIIALIVLLISLTYLTFFFF